MSLHVVGGQYDERRNTSAVRQVPPDALPRALAALATFRRMDAPLVRWLEDGHPTLTDAEHHARFGGPYQRTRTRKATGA